MPRQPTTALVLGALLIAGSAHAAGLPGRDRDFLQKQAQGTSYEIAIAKLAADKASDAGIKSYAQMVASDHDQLNIDLQQLATSKGVDLPTGMTAKQQAGLGRLQALQGRAFDRAFQRETIRINGADVQEDRTELKAASDPDLRGFVQKLQAADQKHAAAGRQLKPA